MRFVVEPSLLQISVNSTASPTICPIPWFLRYLHMNQWVFLLLEPSDPWHTSPLCGNQPHASELGPLLCMCSSPICLSCLLVMVTICMTIPLPPCECPTCYTSKGSSRGAIGKINQMSVFWLILLKSTRTPQCGWSPWNQLETCDAVDFTFCVHKAHYISFWIFLCRPNPLRRPYDTHLMHDQGLLRRTCNTWHLNQYHHTTVCITKHSCKGSCRHTIH